MDVRRARSGSIRSAHDRGRFNHRSTSTSRLSVRVRRSGRVCRPGLSGLGIRTAPAVLVPSMERIVHTRLLREHAAEAEQEQERADDEAHPRERLDSLEDSTHFVVRAAVF